ncbi:hypothetical protein SmJEL517_g05679 [Synchytrium microbalum]|uniref:Proteasome activator subunit 4 n=1 Tax=Synchytrium microbalum TaxID=1806994 RepID=A0A507BYI8_9FUNG|nr:uncharacterized protein SmJEL517_g05679 [Synchytrium microbalum]TPX30864.1 hypothetical protein SmJEL517_g05679 [Synchytrium microbalum]
MAASPDPYRADFLWNELLPYSTGNDNHLQAIIDGLSVEAASGNYAPGVTGWTKHLVAHLDLKLPISEQDRAKIGWLLFTLVINPKMGTALVESYASIIVRLVGKEKFIASTALQLPWRPLYEILKKVFLPKQKDRSLPGAAQHLYSIVKLVEHARRFFPPTAASEILEEMLPNISSPTAPTAAIYQTLMCLFLPTNSIPPQVLTDNSAPPLYFLPTIFSSWQTFTYAGLDTIYFDFLSRVAKDQVGSPENTRWTEDQVKSMFTVALKNMDLPIGSGTQGISGNRGAGSGLKIDGGIDMMESLKKNKFEAFAKFIVYTIYPPAQEGKPAPPPTNTLNALAQLLQAIETYFHPSNYGRWVSPLTRFLFSLSSEFLKRFREEAKPDCETPIHYRLTDDIKKEFVTIIRPCTFFAMFSKDPLSVMSSHSILKQLVWLAPELIFPGLLERVYPALETLTETHRTISCIGALSSTATALFNRSHYPAGGRHVTPLLNLILPGIDVNDPTKTVSTLFFIAHTCMTVPLVDVTKLSSNGGTNNSMEIDAQQDNGMEIDLEEENDACRLATMDFEDWVVSFLERIFVMLENLPQQHGQQGNATIETSILQLVNYAAEQVFLQLSPEIHAVALSKLVKFVTSSTIPNATKAIGTICTTSMGSDPDKNLAAFIPLCHARIMAELSNGAGAVATSSISSTHPFGMNTLSDSTLHWYQSILMGVLSSAGKGVLKYKTELVQVITEMLSVCKGRRGYKWAGKVLRNLLICLLDTYPMELRSVTPQQWADKEYMANIHKRWGAPNAKIDMEWHIPSPAEIEFAMELIQMFWPSTLDHLQNLINKASTGRNTPSMSSSGYKDDSNEFARCINLLCNLLMGTCTLIGPEGSTVQGLSDTDPETPNDNQYPIDAGYVLKPSDPLYAPFLALRNKTGAFLHTLAQHFGASRPDDTDPIKPLVKAVRVYIGDRGLEPHEYEGTRRGYRYLKAYIKTVEDTKTDRPRYSLVKRILLQHSLRRRYNANQQVFDERVKALFSDLAALSVGKYSEIRKLSQTVLIRSIKCFAVAKFKTFYAMTDALLEGGGGFDGTGEKDSDKMKGALYVLKNRVVLGVALSRINASKRLAEVLCGAHGEDKPSVQELIRKTFMEFLIAYSELGIQVHVTTETAQAARALSANVSENEVNTKQSVEISRGISNRRTYHELIDYLLTHVQNPNLHWRFAAMTSNFIELHLRRDEPIPVGLANFVVSQINSELPAVRRTCTSLLTTLFVTVKERAISNGGSALLDVKKIVKADDVDPETWLTDGINPNSSTPLQDNPDLGWLCFPPHAKVYTFAPRDLNSLPYTDTTSQPAMTVIQTALSDPAFWSKHATYLSQESAKGLENFNSLNARFYQAMIGFYQDAFIETCIKPQVVSLVLNHGGEKSKERAGLEILGGIVRGSKHFGPLKLKKMWEWVVPLVDEGLKNVTPETLTFWDSFLSFTYRNRDPRRLLPLIQPILSDPLDPNSSSFFSETKKLYLVRPILASFSWRILPLALPLLPKYIQAMNSPYKQVRELLGSCIMGILQLIWHPSAPNIRTIVQWSTAKDSASQVPIQMDPKIKPIMINLFNDLKKARVEAKALHTTTNVTTPTVYSNTAKTILSWTFEALTTGGIFSIYPYIELLLPAILDMLDSDDSDLVTQANAVVGVYPQLAHTPSLLPPVAKILQDILQDRGVGDATNGAAAVEKPSWHIRIRVLPIIQVFFFRNLFAMPSDIRLGFVKSVLDALFDSQIEIRQLAAVTLSGLIRCSQRDDISVLKTRFATELSKKLPSRVKGSGLPPPLGYQEAILRRHAATLGLSSLVTSTPYEVPDWMPDVLVMLAKCHSDPAPISATVSKTFADFKRTHQDTWHEDSLKFSEDQLYMLTDLLISQSYYA